MLFPFDNCKCYLVTRNKTLENRGERKQKFLPTRMSIRNKKVSKNLKTGISTFRNEELNERDVLIKLSIYS